MCSPVALVNVVDGQMSAIESFEETNWHMTYSVLGHELVQLWVRRVILA